MVWSGRRAGAAGAALGLTTWLVAPWVSMAVRGTLDTRHATWLRDEGGPRPARRATSAPERGMPRAWETIPGPRPRLRVRSGRAG